MKRSGVKAFCFLAALSLSGLPVATQAAPAAENPGAAAKTNTAPSHQALKAPATTDDEETVSINSASAAQLAEVMNGVGLKKAEAIVSYREKYGPFTQLEQLKEVPGIGAALMERNLSRLTL